VEKALPSSVQTEVTVLGASLLSSDCFNDALELLSAEDFSLDSHAKIFTSISELAETGNPVDLITVMEDLTRRRWLDPVGGAAYLAFLTEGIPRNPNIAAYCRIVKDKSVLRSLMVLCDSSSARAQDQSESPAEILGSIEERILELSQAQTTQAFTTILDSVEEVGSVDAYMEKMCDPAELTGLPSGFKDIDDVLGGFQRGELTLIAARPGQGKTAMALNIATNIVQADADSVVALFSLEMSKISLHKRMIASLADVNSRRAQQGFLSQEERRRMKDSLIRIADRHLMIDDTPAITTMQMRARCRRLKQQKGRLDLVAVDYLQLLKGIGKHGNRQEEVASISRGLKALSRELDVPVLALSQVGRSSEQRADKRPMLSDLRESGSQEADADVVAFIHREDYYAAEDDENVERGTAEFIIAKNRHGGTGTRKLAYKADVTRFANLEIQRSTNAY
jgi:replicative DNA helicase